MAWLKRSGAIAMVASKRSPGRRGSLSLGSRIAGAAVAIVAAATLILVIFASRYNQAQTRDDLEHKIAALTGTHSRQ